MQAEMKRFREDKQTRLANFIQRANEEKEALQRQCAVAVRVKKMVLFCQQMESSREKFASLLRDSAFLIGRPSGDKEGDDLSGAENQNEQRVFITDCMGRLGDTTHHFWNKYKISPWGRRGDKSTLRVSQPNPWNPRRFDVD
jgi:hypothetical protein